MFYHLHHIVPKHAGGNDDSSNLMRVTIEQHAEEHRKLFEKFGREEDRIAWLALSGQIGKEEARRLAVKAWASRRDNTPYQTQEFRDKHRIFGEDNPAYGKPGYWLNKQGPWTGKKRPGFNVGKSGKENPMFSKKRSDLFAMNKVIATCPKCGKSIQRNALIRWHGLNGEKCKVTDL